LILTSLPESGRCRPAVPGRQHAFAGRHRTAPHEHTADVRSRRSASSPRAAPASLQRPDWARPKGVVWSGGLDAAKPSLDSQACYEARSALISETLPSSRRSETSMNAQTHLPILRRIGAVLVAVGFADIGVMIYCVLNRISYSSSFNIFSIVAGVFLLRGSLNAVAAVRLFAAFMLSGFIALLVALPLIQPVDLTITQIRLNPGYSLIEAVLMMSVILLLGWVIQGLGSEPVQAAFSDAGRKAQKTRAAATIGVGLVVVLCIAVGMLSSGESAEHAKAIASQQVGPGYRLHVSSLSISTGDRGTVGSGVVTAWNHDQVREINVHW
jgi:hypothetical protein